MPWARRGARARWRVSQFRWAGQDRGARAREESWVTAGFLDAFLRRADREPEGIAFVLPRESGAPALTNADVRDGALRWATLLRAAGARPGDVVLLSLPLCRALLESFVGALVAGCKSLDDAGADPQAGCRTVLVEPRPPVHAARRWPHRHDAGQCDCDRDPHHRRDDDRADAGGCLGGCGWRPGPGPRLAGRRRRLPPAQLRNHWPEEGRRADVRSDRRPVGGARTRVGGGAGRHDRLLAAALPTTWGSSPACCSRCAPA